MAAPLNPIGTDLILRLTAQYGCGPVKFSGTDEALYERHLLFDNIVDASQVTLRERYEAVARSVRDLLSQRWIRTGQTYERENPKHVYYLCLPKTSSCVTDGHACATGTRDGRFPDSVLVDLARPVQVAGAT